VISGFSKFAFSKFNLNRLRRGGAEGGGEGCGRERAAVAAATAPDTAGVPASLLTTKESLGLETSIDITL
jgi:hypothetical protein